MTYKETVLADSPAGYWRLGEASGTTAADSSGNGRSATYANVTLGATGLIANDSNTAATFNGTSSEVSRADETLFDLPGNFTLEAWIKPTAVGAARSILSKTEGEAWGLELTATNKVLFYFRTEAGEFPEVVGGSVVANNTYHVVVTKSSTTLILWVNGAKISEFATTKVPRNQAGKFRIGKFSNEVPQPFIGVIDEVAIYESALSETRIKAHYAVGTTKAGPPVNTALPVITGTPRVGSTLTCSTGEWTGAESYAYQWQSYSVSLEKWHFISGATSATYTVEEFLVGQKVRCVVTATNEVGSTEASSESVGLVEAAEEEEPRRVRRNRKPPLDLDVEVETTAGTFRLASDDPKASNRPSNMSFTTLRGNGFSNGSLQLNRQIFRDYPDVNLLDTWRMIGRQGEVAYEGRLHSDPRTNSPSQTLNVELVGWMSYLTSRKISPLIIDRTLDGWTGPSSGRRASLITAGYRYEAEPEVGWHGEGAPGPGIIFTFSTFGSSYYELGEAWKRAGGEAIGALRFDFQSLAGGADANWSTVGYLCDNDLAESFVPGTNLHKTTTAGNEVVSDGEAVYQYALLAESYTGTFTGTTNEVHGFFNPRIVGTHGLTARGESPNEGYYVSDIIKYVLNTYYPKINTEHVKENQFAVQQATWAESPVYGSELISQLNDLTLWEENLWENRSYHYEPADLTKTDWQIRTDEPGVEVTFQGESIENFANGVVVTYTDFSGIRHVLYPDQHSELRDTSLNNAATEHGEDLWTGVEVRWPATEPEALQYGRAYLAEYNRPKRPGTFTIKSGYIKDGAGHWQPGWRVRNSATLSVMDHPSESAPRLITATSWDDNSKSLSITVDAPPSTFDAIVARTVLALSAHNTGT